MQRVRSTTCLHLRSPLRKRGVERVKIRPLKGKRNDQLASYNFYWMAYGNILFLFIFNISISQKAPIMKILARSQFCLLTILLHLQLVLWLTFFFSQPHYTCVSFKIPCRIFVQFTLIRNILESFIQSENNYQC